MIVVFHPVRRPSEKEDRTKTVLRKKTNSVFPISKMMYNDILPFIINTTEQFNE